MIMELHGTDAGRAMLAGHVTIGAFRVRVLVAPFDQQPAPAAFQLWITARRDRVRLAKALRVGSWGWARPSGDGAGLRVELGENMEAAIRVLDPDVERVRADIHARLHDLAARLRETHHESDPAVRAALERTLYANPTGAA